MPIPPDPEWMAAAQEMFAALANATPPKIHDVQGIRKNVQTLVDSRPVLEFPDLQTITHTFESFDGTKLRVIQIKSAKQANSGLQPAVLHIHGGGMIAGSAEGFSGTPKAFAHLSGIQFFDVDYRLAPEFPDPTPTEDCFAALKWLHAHAEEFGVDRARIGIMGESAGGGLAAGVTLIARDRALQPPLAKSILIYPMLDSRNIVPVKEPNPIMVWSMDNNITGWTALLGDRLGSADVSPYASPSHAKDLSNLPPTYIDVGTLDLFRDEDVSYAQRLAAVENDVEFHLYPGVPHAFEFLSETAIAKKAMANRLSALASF